MLISDSNVSTSDANASMSDVNISLSDTLDLTDAIVLMNDASMPINATKASTSDAKV